MTPEAKASRERAEEEVRKALAATAEAVMRAEAIPSAWERRLRRLKARRPLGG